MKDKAIFAATALSKTLIAILIIAAAISVQNCGREEKPDAADVQPAKQSVVEQPTADVPPFLEKIVFLKSNYRYNKLAPVPRLVTHTISLVEQAGQLLNILEAGPVREAGILEGLPEDVKRSLPDRIRGELPERELHVIPEAVRRAIANRRMVKRFYLTEKGTAVLILHRALSEHHDGGVLGELTTVFSIVNTLCVNFPFIQRVQLVLEGINPTTLAGHVDITEPFYLDETYFSFTSSEPEALDDASFSRSEVSTIIIDPGHGSTDPGAVYDASGRALAEKDVTLDVARRLRRLIEEDGFLRRAGVEVVLTRDAGDDGIELDLMSRAAIANRQDGGLFISIHANTKPTRNAFGACTYILSRDPRSGLSGSAVGGSLPRRRSGDLELLSFARAHIENVPEAQDRQLGKCVQSELNSNLDHVDRTYAAAPLRLLRGVAMPAVLVEVHWASNRRQDLILWREEYRNLVAASLLDGIKRYIRGARY